MSYTNTGAPPVFIFHERLAYRRFRRTMDVAIALAALVLASPLLLAAALAIVAEDGGPVLFKQRRTGRFERLFTIYKFRTMKTDLCGDALSPQSGGDPRVTRIGRILRKTSIDEVPQLINVLRGEMSLVGPRPEMPFIVHGYQRWQHLRHLASPGITCIWQTRHRSTVPLHEPAATMCDLEYIQSASPAADGALLAQTIGAVLLPKGAF